MRVQGSADEAWASEEVLTQESRKKTAKAVQFYTGWGTSCLNDPFKHSSRKQGAVYKSAGCFRTVRIST